MRKSMFTLKKERGSGNIMHQKKINKNQPLAGCVGLRPSKCLLIVRAGTGSEAGMRA